jgi:hypothetical protein
LQAEVSTYLQEVKTHLHLDPGTERRVMSELYAHFEEKVSDLQGQGVPEPEATREAIASFGGARSIARLIYEAHSRGSWTEALISCQPHLIIAALFFTHVWRYPVLLAAAFTAITLIAIFGWRKGAPLWLYSWLGYAVFPLLILSYMFRDPVTRTIIFLFTGGGSAAPLWHLGALALLYAFTLWLLVSAVIRVARRDWIFVSLMLLPLPVLAIWLISVTQTGIVLPDALRGLGDRFSRWDSAMASFCATLGVTCVLFIRVRQRALKALSVISVGMVGSAAVVRSIWADPGLFSLVVVSFCLLLFLTSPFLVHAFVGREEEPKEAPLSRSS